MNLGRHGWATVTANCIHPTLEPAARGVLHAMERGCGLKPLYKLVASFTEQCGDYIAMLSAGGASETDRRYARALTRLYHALEAKLTRHECGAALLQPADVRRYVEHWLAEVEELVAPDGRGDVRNHSSAVNSSTWQAAPDTDLRVGEAA